MTCLTPDTGQALSPKCLLEWLIQDVLLNKAALFCHLMGLHGDGTQLFGARGPLRQKIGIVVDHVQHSPPPKQNRTVKFVLITEDIFEMFSINNTFVNFK